MGRRCPESLASGGASTACDRVKGHTKLKTNIQKQKISKQDGFEVCSLTENSLIKCFIAMLMKCYIITLIIFANLSMGHVVP